MPHIQLTLGSLEALRTMNPRLMSYNVEMTEVTGGTFWKATPMPRSTAPSRFPLPIFPRVWPPCTSGTIPSIPPIPG